MSRELGAFTRFIGAGAFNSLLTGAALSLLSVAIPPLIAYPIVYVLGIALSVFLAGKFVFNSHFSVKRVVLYVITYLAIFLVGLVVVASLERAGVPAWAMGSVIFVTAPLGFLAGRLIFKPQTADEY